MQLAQRCGFFRAVRSAVDHRATRTANSLPAVIIKRDRVLAFDGKLLVDGIQKFDERHMHRHIFNRYHFKMSLALGSLLAPNLQCDIYSLG